MAALAALRYTDEGNIESPLNAISVQSTVKCCNILMQQTLTDANDRLRNH